MVHSQQGVNAVDIAVTILHFVVAQTQPCRATDIAAGCNLSKSRLHKYLVSLCRTGMLRQDEKGHYCPGNTLSELAGRTESTLISQINSALRRFRDAMNCSTGLVLIEGDGLILRHYHRSFRNVDIDCLDNTPVPVNASAAGQIYQYYVEGDAQISPDSDRVRRPGYAVRYKPSKGIPGAQSVACPVLHNGQLVAIGVAMGFFEDDAEIDRTGKALQQMLAQLELN